MISRINKALDFNYLLIENYRKMGLNEVELAAVFIIKQIICDGNNLITADLLSLRMSLSVKDIDNLLVSLLNKGIIEYNAADKGLITSLHPLEKRLLREFEVNFLKYREETTSLDYEEHLQNIYQIFEKELGRILSPLEFTRIRDWLSNGYSEETIILALKEALASGKKTIRAVDKVLLNKGTRDDLEKEGYSARNDKWDKDIEKTIEIAASKWIDE